MIGKRDGFWGGYEKQSVLELRWHRVAVVVGLLTNLLFCSVVVGQFYSGLVHCVSHRSTVFADSKPCFVPGDVQLLRLLWFWVVCMMYVAYDNVFPVYVSMYLCSGLTLLILSSEHLACWNVHPLSPRFLFYSIRTGLTESACIFDFMWSCVTCDCFLFLRFVLWFLSVLCIAL